MEHESITSEYEAVEAAGDPRAPRTMAGILPSSCNLYGPKPALRYKDGDTWRDLSYRELGETVTHLSLGLAELGIEAGDRVAVLADTRPGWCQFDFAALCAGAIVVPIYQSNSPAECRYVLSDSDAKAIVVEDETQLEKIRAVRADLSALEHVIVMDAEERPDAASKAELAARGRAADQALFEERLLTISPEDLCTVVYTSGTTGTPKGCMISHDNYRRMVSMVEALELMHADDVTYLYLPLAHVFARLIAFMSLDLGATLAFSESIERIVPNLAEVRPTFFPSVPRIFEKIHASTTASLAGAPADERTFAKVRDLFGGNLRTALTGAAPIATEILEFFWAAGVPVYEGWGMTETSTAGALNSPAAYKLGTIGRPIPPCEIDVADDGEILVRGPNVFRGYWRNEQATRETIVDGWLHTGDLGEINDDGFVTITGRKKEIIITAGGKNISPAAIESALKESPYVSQAVAYGDRRPFLTALITLDQAEVTPFARERGLDASDPTHLAQDGGLRQLIQEAVDRANERFARPEQVKAFAILSRDLSQAEGELTPTLKVKRNVIYEKYADVFEDLYARRQPTS